MKYKSVFDIIGPVMVGPSSSHTAGAIRIGQIARKIFGKEPEEIEVHFYGSFAETYKGHATDVAVIAGLMGFATDDIRVGRSIEIAEEKGIRIHFYKEQAHTEHPNTVGLVLKSADDQMEIVGISVGGGAVQITELDGFPLKLSGENPAMVILHKDTYGVVASVAAVLMRHKINISHMEVSRADKGSDALMVIETDQIVSQEGIDEITGEDHVKRVIILDE